MLGLKRQEGPETDILVVCTANVCRSQYIAAALAAALPGLRIASAGTAAVTGTPPSPEILDGLTGRGIVAGAELPAARRLRRRLVRGSRLIVTATRRHRVSVVQLDGSAAARAFTLKELARAGVGAVSGGGIDALCARAAEQAGEEVDHDDDLADPYGLEPTAYVTMMDEVDAALGVLVPVLR